jgi:hypothetical protein
MPNAQCHILCTSCVDVVLRPVVSLAPSRPVILMPHAHARRPPPAATPSCATHRRRRLDASSALLHSRAAAASSHPVRQTDFLGSEMTVMAARISDTPKPHYATLSGRSCEGLGDAVIPACRRCCFQITPRAGHWPWRPLLVTMWHSFGAARPAQRLRLDITSP